MQLVSLAPMSPVNVSQSLMQLDLREGIKKTVFLGDLSQMCFPTHPPQGFVRFGKTKGEIWVKKGDFRGDFGGF